MEVQLRTNYNKYYLFLKKSYNKYMEAS